MIDILEKACRECGSRFRGRVDKKFCSDQCRSAHNNRLNTDATDYIRRINYILRRNRRILTELNAQGKNRVGAEKLKIKGFDFNYFTSMYVAHDGRRCYYCYDHGYSPLEHDDYVILAKEDVS